MKMEVAGTLRVNDVMTRNPICVTAGMSAREIGELLDVNEISGAPVVNAADRLIGVVSKSDLIHRCVKELFDDGTGTMWSSWASRRAWDPQDLGLVGDFMSSDPVTATPGETIADVAARMAERHVHRVVVVDEEALVIGVLTTMDVIEAIGASPRQWARNEPKHIALGIRPRAHAAA